MKNKQTLILKLIIITIIIIIFIILLLLANVNTIAEDTNSNITSDNTNAEENVSDEEEIDDENYIYEEYIDEGDEIYMSQENDIYTFISINKIIEKYLSCISKEDLTSVYNMLNTDYINENKVTENNILNNVNTVENYSNYFATKMYMYTYDDFMDETIYYVNGDVYYNNYTENKQVYIRVDINWETMLFSITPLVELEDKDFKTVINEKNKELWENDGQNADIETAKQENENNQFEYLDLTIEDIINRYVLFFNAMLRFNTEKSYEYIDEETKSNLFNTYEKYKEYISENNFTKIEYDSYEFNGDDNTYIFDLSGNERDYSISIECESGLMDFVITIN